MTVGISGNAAGLCKSDALRGKRIDTEAAVRIVNEWTTPWPWHLARTVRTGDFLHRASTVSHTRPGRDGLPYVAWHRAGMLGAGILHSVYDWQISGHTLGGRFNDLVQIFPLPLRENPPMHKTPNL